MSDGELVRDIPRRELDATTADAHDPAERLQHAERQLQLAIQHRARDRDLRKSERPHDHDQTKGRPRPLLRDLSPSGGSTSSIIGFVAIFVLFAVTL